MSASKIRSILFVPLLAITSISFGTWELVPQSPGTSNTWSKVDCEAGNGWRPCVKPQLVCRYDANNKFVSRSQTCRGSSNWPINCTSWAWGIRTLWDGVCGASRPGYTAGALISRKQKSCGMGEVVTDSTYQICRLE